VVDEPREIVATGEDGHLQGVESEVGPKARSGPPANDTAGEDIDDE
jgi:hypothetical protein